MTPLWLAMVAWAWAGAFPGPEAVAAFEGNARSGYVFASFTSPSFASRATVVARVTTSYLYYAYPGAGSEVRVRSPGLAVAGGVRWRPERLSLTAVAGYEARHTMEFDAEEQVRSRTEHGVSLGADAHAQVNSGLAFAFVGHYGFSDGSTWGRVLGKHQVFPLEGSSVAVVALGLDATVRGNADVIAADAGLLLDVGVPGQGLSFGVRFGLGRELQPGAGSGLAPALGTSIHKSF